MAAPTKKVFDVFVNKIPWTLATKEMKEYFVQFGQIKRLILPFDRETGFNRGFCRVSYTTEEGMQNALQKELHVIEGSRLQVQKDRRPSVEKRLSGDRDDI